MLSRLTISSIPGMRASSSAITESRPRLRSTWLSFSCTLPQLWRISSSTLTSCAHRFDASTAGSEESGVLKQSARLCARSVLTTSVRLPSAAERAAVAAAMVVLPTPPLPRYSIIRISPCFLNVLFFRVCEADREGRPYNIRALDVACVFSYQYVRRNIACGYFLPKLSHAGGRHLFARDARARASLAPTLRRSGLRFPDRVGARLALALANAHSMQKLDAHPSHT